MKLSRIFAAMMVVALSFSMVACEKKGPMEKAGEKVDQAASDVKDAAKDVADDIKDAVDPDN